MSFCLRTVLRYTSSARSRTPGPPRVCAYGTTRMPRIQELHSTTRIRPRVRVQHVPQVRESETVRAMPRALRPPVSQKSIQPVCHSRMLLSRSVMAGQVASRSPAMCARSPAVISPPSSSPTRASTRRHGAARAHGSRTRHNECTRQTGRGGALDAGADVRPTGLLALAGGEARTRRADRAACGC